jgi:hypothetical protein
MTINKVEVYKEMAFAAFALSGNSIIQGRAVF